mmetsp:Transcript_1792/g.1897  ORF Transcript_1792/g.1897 Transcript_1792/m.1897 type:complete len:85 (+) Transcript_1792:2-256(+)
MHGRGRLEYRGGQHYYDGAFIENKRCGYGWCRYGDGSFYDGHWLNDKPHGPGKYCKGDKKWTIGRWEEGALIAVEKVYSGKQDT